MFNYLNYTMLVNFRPYVIGKLSVFTEKAILALQIISAFAETKCFKW